MNIKNSLKNFFRPRWGKLILLFFLEFFLTVVILLFEESLAPWQLYLLEPNILYLQSTINLMLSTNGEIAFHGAVANVIALFYFYFLSCLIVGMYDRIYSRKVEKNETDSKNNKS